MYYFTYNDYVDYVQNGNLNRLKRIDKLEDQNEKYICTNDSHSEEKIRAIKLIKDKNKMIKFLNTFLKLSEKIYVKDLKDYNNLISKEKDSFLYKIKQKEIYILTKIIDTKDYNLSYKMLNISIEIIENWNKLIDKKDLRYPIVVPIVIYTGEEEWQEQYNYSRYITYESNAIYLNYNLFNVSKFIKFFD